MAEFDAVQLNNPTSEDFSHNFNGESYTIEANSSRSFAKFVGFHLAKHLAQQMLKDEITPKIRKEQPTLLSQRLTYDNPYLRIALYKIFNDVVLVEKLISVYPFKGFVGDMKIYEKFVDDSKKSKDKVDGQKPE